MEEVAIKIRFKTACLGARKVDGHRCRFERGGGDHVLFMQSWWREIVEYGAKAASPSVSTELAKQISFAPTVDGQIKSFRRHYRHEGQHGYKDHEAFLPGQVIGVRAMLPDGLTRSDVERILRVAGPYKGLSPYGKDALGFGRFDVLEVQPIRAGRGHQSECTDQA